MPTAAPRATRTPVPVPERSRPTAGTAEYSRPAVDIPVDGGDLSRTGLEESVGNAVVAYPERTRTRATVIDGSGGDGTPETVR